MNSIDELNFLSEDEEPTWEDLIGYPKGIYDSFPEMIYGEYGEDSEQAYDLNRTFREARIRNDPTYGF